MDLANSSEDKAPYDMRMLYYISLASLLDQKDRASASGDVWAWMAGLKAVYRRAKFMFNKEERGEMEAELDKCSAMLKIQTPGSESLALELLNMTAVVSEPKLAVIDGKLWDLLHKYNMIFPRIDKDKGFKEIRDRYGIGGEK